jgi:hypothetical protein
MIKPNTYYNWVCSKKHFLFLLVSLSLLNQDLFAQCFQELESSNVDDSNLFNTQIEFSVPWRHGEFEQEIISLRDERTKHFLCENGSVSAFFASNLIHYQAPDGSWLDIDNAVRVNSNDELNDYPYFNETGVYKNYFPSNPFLNPVMALYKDAIVKDRIKSIYFVDEYGNVVSSLVLDFSNIIIEVSANSIVYTNFFPDLALKYSLGNSGRKFNLEILSTDFLNCIPQGAVSLLIEEDIWVESQSNRSLIFSESEIGLSLLFNDEHILDYLKPIAYDNDHSNEFSKLESSYTWTQTFSNSGIFLSIFDCNWITSSDREFPLFLDPVVNYLPTLTTNWTGRQQTSAGKTSGYLRITGNTTSSWAKYNISTLPSNAIINSVIYWGNHYSGNGNYTAKQCRLRHMTSDPVPASAATIWNACNNGTIVSPNFIWAQGSSYQWRSITLNASGTSTLQNSISQGWYALGTQWVSGGTSFAYHYGVDGTTAQITYIQVDYTSCSTGIVNSAQTICSGTQPGTLTVSSSSGSIQWQFSSDGLNWTNISGATSTSLSSAQMGALTSNRYYRVINTGVCSSSPPSNSILITINAINAGNISANQTICSGTFPSTITSISSATGSGNITYQWQNSINGSTWTNIAGATGLTYTPPSLSSTNYYRRLATSTLNGNNCSAISSTITITVNSISAGSISADQTICSGTIPSTLTSQSTATGSGTITYQWQSSTNGSTWTDIAGATSVSYSAPALLSTTQYRRVARSTLSSLECIANSNSVTITVNSVSAGQILGEQLICAQILPNPLVSQIAASASGQISYQWQSSSNGLSWTNIPGATSLNYNPPPLNSTLQYRRAVNSVLNSINCIDYSNNVIIEINPLPFVYAGSDQFICLGDEVVLSGSGSNNYLWSNGVLDGEPFSPQASSNYIVYTTSDMTGCTGSDTVQIIVNLPSSSVVNASSIGPFFINGQIFSTSGTYYQNTLNQFGCDSLITINITIYTLDLEGFSSNNTIAIYPNPTVSGWFKLVIPDELKCQKLSMFNYIGELIQVMNVDDVIFDVSMLTAGVYFLRIDCSGYEYVLKIQKI